MSGRIIVAIAGYIIFRTIQQHEHRMGRATKKTNDSIIDMNKPLGKLLDSLSSFNMDNIKKLFGNVSKVVIGLLVLLFVFSGVKIISPGERGIRITFGKVSTTELAEGLHWKIPLVQTIKPLTVKVQKLEATSNSASKDLQVVQTSIALNYSLKPGNIVRLYQTIGDEDIIKSKIIQPAIQESVKAATAQFTAEQLISKRAEVNKAIFDGLVTKLDLMGIEVVAVNIVNFEFSTAFNLAIEDKVKAEQEAFTEKNRLEKIKFQAQQKIETAKGDAESVLLKAKAEAEANIIIAESLTDSLVKYKGIEKRDGLLPTVTSDAGLILQGEF